MNTDCRQIREDGLQSIPDPPRQVFTGRIVEPFDLIQIIVIEAGDKGIGGGFDLAVVDEVAFFGIDFPFDDDVKAKGMAVQPAAFVAVGECGEIVGGFEVELFGEADAHRPSILGSGWVIEKAAPDDRKVESLNLPYRGVVTHRRAELDPPTINEVCQRGLARN